MGSHFATHRYSGPRHARPAGPRHARPMPPSAAHRTVAATGVAAALVAGETMTLAGTAGAVTPDTWAKLRMCESSGNYAVNTGNGYYGAYQFNLPTWRGLGYQGLPSEAAPAVQDQAAQRLYAARGWEPWPACSARLGLVDDRQASRSDARPPLTSPAPTAAPAAPVVATAAPTPSSVPTAVAGAAWDGHYITVRDVGSTRTDVKLWQQKMVAAGYHLAVDGRYGPQSAAAATAFETDHGLHVERPAVVGPQVWNALFSK
jgi:resuscitation-promoting factor RpfA